MPMAKRDFNKVALQLYFNHTWSWVISYQFAAYFQNTFSKEHLWRAASVKVRYLKNTLKQLFNKTKTPGKPTYIVSDLNSNLLDCHVNAKVKTDVKLLFQNNYVPLISKPTRISKTNATIIDHIYTNNF